MHRFFSFKGKIGRRAFWGSMLVVWLIFTLLFFSIQTYLGTVYTWMLYPFFFWSIAALMARRYHDRSKSGFWSLLLLIPILGPIVVFWELGFLKEKH